MNSDRIYFLSKNAMSRRLYIFVIVFQLTIGRVLEGGDLMLANLLRGLSQSIKDCRLKNHFLDVQLFSLKKIQNYVAYQWRSHVEIMPSIFNRHVLPSLKL